MRVTLMADKYYRIESIDKGDVDIRGDGGSVTSVSRSSDERSNDTLKVSITLSRLDGDDDEGDYDLEINDLNWDEDDGSGGYELFGSPGNYAADKEETDCKMFDLGYITVTPVRVLCTDEGSVARVRENGWKI